MKRTIIFSVALLSAVMAQAQGVKEVEKAMFARDSVLAVLAENRVNYAKNESKREELAPVILSLEKEVVRLQAEYDKALAAMSQEEMRNTLALYEKNGKSSASDLKDSKKVVDSKNRYTPDPSRLKRDLVANDYFAERLSAADYTTLRKAQSREIEVKNLIDKYMAEYGELLSLQRKYMEVPTKAESDAISLQFNAKLQAMTQLEETIKSAWGPLYYNKFYAYDLLMERGGNTPMLDFSAEITARAEREINDGSDLYQSDALVSYFARKKALAEYEMRLASSLSLTTAVDSLKTVVSELKNRDYRLSKLSLQRRSFIDYEDIKVQVPTIYTSKNPVPQTKVYDYGTIYRIRIGLFSKRPNLSALRGVTPLSYTTAYNNGTYAYFVGGFRTEQEAKEGVAYLKKLGFRDPIIAVWVDGEYYPTVEDMRRSESQYNIEISGVSTLTDDMKSLILGHKSDCTISRIGSTFIVGTFEGKSVAEAVVADLKATNAEMSVKVVKKP